MEKALDNPTSHESLTDDKKDSLLIYSPVNFQNLPTNATKLIKKGPDGNLIKENLIGRYARGWANEVSFFGLKGLYHELLKRADDPHSYIIRAKARFWIDLSLSPVYRRKDYAKWAGQ